MISELGIAPSILDCHLMRFGKELFIYIKCAQWYIWFFLWDQKEQKQLGPWHRIYCQARTLPCLVIKTGRVGWIGKNTDWLRLSEIVGSNPSQMKPITYTIGTRLLPNIAHGMTRIIAMAGILSSTDLVSQTGSTIWTCHECALLQCVNCPDMILDGATM